MLEASLLIKEKKKKQTWRGKCSKPRVSQKGKVDFPLPANAPRPDSATFVKYCLSDVSWYHIL